MHHASAGRRLRLQRGRTENFVEADTPNKPTTAVLSASTINCVFPRYLSEISQASAHFNPLKARGTEISAHIRNTLNPLCVRCRDCADDVLLAPPLNNPRLSYRRRTASSWSLLCSSAHMKSPCFGLCCLFVVKLGEEANRQQTEHRRFALL